MRFDKIKRKCPVSLFWMLIKGADYGSTDRLPCYLLLLSSCYFVLALFTSTCLRSVATHSCINAIIELINTLLPLNINAHDYYYRFRIDFEDISTVVYFHIRDLHTNPHDDETYEPGVIRELKKSVST